MPLSEQRDNLLLGRFELLGIGDLHVDIAKIGPADYTLHRARVRHDYDVVLVYALRAQSLGRQNTGDCERHLFDSQDLADRIFVSINLRGGGATDHTNLVRAANVLRCKRRAISQRPLPDVKIIR